MERPVVIAGIVVEITGPGHLVEEPSVDAFVEMRRFDRQKPDPEYRGENNDQDRYPTRVCPHVFDRQHHKILKKYPPPDAQ